MKCLAIRIISGGFRVNTESRTGILFYIWFLHFKNIIMGRLSRHFNPEVLEFISAKFSINVHFAPTFLSLCSIGTRLPNSIFLTQNIFPPFIWVFHSLLHFETQSENSNFKHPKLEISKVAPISQFFFLKIIRDEI